MSKTVREDVECVRLIFASQVAREESVTFAVALPTGTITRNVSGRSSLNSSAPFARRSPLRALAADVASPSGSSLLSAVAAQPTTLRRARTERARIMVGAPEKDLGRGVGFRPS